MRRRVKASFAGSTQAGGSRRGLFGRAFATRGVSSGVDGSGAPSYSRIAIAAFLSALCVLALAAGPAFAKKTHLLKLSFGAPGSAAGQLNLGATAGSGESSGVAVNDTTGDVYVADLLNRRVDQFSSGGAFIRAWGWGVEDGASELQTCSEATGCLEGLSGSAPGQFAAPVSIAIDNSAGPSGGDVYVGDRGDNVVSKFAPDGSLISSWGSGGQLTGSTATDGPFGTLAGLVVDAAGNLDVLSANGFLYRFAQDGTFINDFSTPNFIFPTGLALAPTGNFFKVRSSGAPDEFGPTGSEIGQISITNVSDATGLAVDSSTGILFVSTENFFPGPGDDREPQVDEYAFNGAGEVIQSSGTCPVVPDVGCEPTSFFGLGDIGITMGVAVNSANHLVYAADSGNQRIDVFSAVVLPDVATKPASEVKPTSATLNGTVNPAKAGAASCSFVWGTTIAFGRVAPCSAGVAEGEDPVPVHTELPELQPDTTYHFRLQATNSQGTNTGEPSQDLEFSTPGPGIKSASASEIASSSATLQAEIDPNGAPTTYYFEYGTDTGYGATAPAPPGASIGSGINDVAVSQRLQDLASNATYHYRVVARSELGTGLFEEFHGPDHTFTTQLSGTSFSLLDNRAWELVSPVEKHGAGFGALTPGALTEAAASGGAISYTGDPTEVDAPANAGGSQLISARGSAGWASRDVTPPNAAAVGGASETPYRAFSPDLSHAVIQPRGGFNPGISPEASEQTPYLRTLFPSASPTDFCLTGCYRPLVTGAAGFANVPPGTVFGPYCDRKSCVPQVLGASSDASHIVLSTVFGDSHVGLTSIPGDEGGLYEWSAGQLKLISILPEGGGPVSSLEHPALGHAVDNDRRAISSDGSRVVWSLGTEGGAALNTHLYLRDTVAEETLQLDQVQPGASGAGPVSPAFQIASADASRIFFTDQQRLTTDSGVKTDSADLYECHVIEQAGQLHCEVNDLTPPPGSGPLGKVIGASTDGSSVYFVSDGVLAHNAVENGGGPEEATAGDCEGPPAGATCNLYLRHDGTTTFIATLSGADQPDWSAVLSKMTARVSPNGHWLAFMSNRTLTGYDSRDIATGTPAEEVYLYHASVGGNGRIVCASCEPTGGRPHAIPFLNTVEPPLIEGGEAFEVPVAANVPAWQYPNESGTPFYQSRYLSDSGRLFFNAVSALSPQDSNGTADVYEYEPPQDSEEAPPQDTCTVESPTFSPRSAGCVALVSSGTSSKESAFLDASESGGDVFFISGARISFRDADTSNDVYDARSGGGEPEPPQPVDCEGDGCQLPAVPPNDSTPGSLTFNGAGNLHESSAADKKHKKKHKRKHQRKSKGKSHKRTAGNKRGGQK